MDMHQKRSNMALDKALLESELQLKAVIDTAVDGIIIIDTKGVIIRVNPATSRLFGYTDEEMIGQNVKLLMPSPHRDAHDGYLDNYHKTGEKHIIGIGRDVDGKRKDGSEFPFRLSISQVDLESGRLYTGVIHDMTESVEVKRRLIALNESLEDMVEERTGELERTMAELEVVNKAMAEEILSRKNKELEVRQLLEKEIELGELKSRFVSMASHEFRTPLTGIQSASSLIDRYDGEGQSADRKRLTDMIRKSVRSLTNILNDFLSMDKLQSGKVSIHPTSFEMVDFVQGVIEEIEHTFGTSDRIILQADAPEMSVHMDKNIMKNVVINLLSNAIKYSGAQDQVEVGLESNSDELRLTVVDHGIGIPEAEQHHMFERFFRADNATNIKGTGLGLNIVKRYLELMQGEITFESQEGVGTTFEVRLPKRYSEPATTTED